eukprot:GILK01004832.1.p1 GENE.GILK01004832.1~~GILK01004832.1.p1  ORF type:complete len:1636 (-),score=439.84 GILK01004832.1:84-4286(-)
MSAVAFDNNDVTAIQKLVSQITGIIEQHAELANRIKTIQSELVQASEEDTINLKEKDVSSAVDRLIKTLATDSKIESMFNSVVEHARHLFSADRGTLFLVDSERKELWSKVAEGTSEIRIPLHKGVAGYVARSGEVVIIPDAYADPRFNPEYDLRTDYKTRNILCSPITDSSGQVIGVLQLLNRRVGGFTSQEGSQLMAMCVQLAAIIQNYVNTRREVDELKQNLSLAQAELMSAKGRVQALYSESESKRLAQRRIVAESTDDLERLTQSLNEVMQELFTIRSAESVLPLYHEQLSSLQSSLTTLRSEFDSMKDHANDQIREFAWSLQSSHDVAAKVRQAYLYEKEQEQAKTAATAQQIRSLQEQVVLLNSQLASSEENLASSLVGKQEQKELKAAVSLLEEQLSRARLESKKLSSDLDSASRTIRELNDKLLQMGHNLKDSQTALQRTQDGERKLLEENAQQKKQLENLNQDLKMYENQLNNTQSILQEVQEELYRCKQKEVRLLEEHDRQLANVSEQLRILKSQLNQHRTEAKQLKDLYETEKVSGERLKMSLESQLRDAKEGSDTARSALERELSYAKERQEHLEQQLKLDQQEHSDRIEILNRELEYAKEEHRAAESEGRLSRQRLERELSECHTQVAQWQESVHILQQRVAEMTRERTDIEQLHQEKLQHAMANLNALHTSLSHTEAESSKMLAEQSQELDHCKDELNQVKRELTLKQDQQSLLEEELRTSRVTLIQLEERLDVCRQEDNVRTRQVEMHSRLLHMCKALYACHHFDTLAKTVEQCAKELYGAADAILFCADPMHPNRLVPALPERMNQPVVHIGSGVIGTVAMPNGPHIVNVTNPVTDILFKPGADDLPIGSTRNCLTVKLTSVLPQSKLRGVLHVVNKSSGGFSDFDQHCLGVLGSHVSIAVDNLHTILSLEEERTALQSQVADLTRTKDVVQSTIQITEAQLRQREQELAQQLVQVEAKLRRTLQDQHGFSVFIKGLAACQRLSIAFDLIQMQLKHIVNCQFTRLFIAMPNESRLWTKTESGVDSYLNLNRPSQNRLVGSRAVADVATAGKIIVTSHEDLSTRQEDFVNVEGIELRNMICVPIKTSQGAIIGVIQAVNRSEHRFEDGDVSSMEAVSAVLCLVHTNLDYIEQVEHVRTRAAVDVSMPLQRSLGLSGSLIKDNPLLDQTSSSRTLSASSQLKTVPTVISASVAELASPLEIAAFVKQKGHSLFPTAETVEYVSTDFDPSSSGSRFEVDRTAVEWRTLQQASCWIDEWNAAGTVMSVPVVDRYGSVRGLIRVMARQRESFSNVQEQLLSELKQQVESSLNQDLIQSRATPSLGLNAMQSGRPNLSADDILLRSPPVTTSLLSSINELEKRINSVARKLDRQPDQTSRLSDSKVNMF